MAVISVFYTGINASRNAPYKWQTNLKQFVEHGMLERSHPQEKRDTARPKKRWAGAERAYKQRGIEQRGRINNVVSKPLLNSVSHE
jgi:hypothetical protein